MISTAQVTAQLKEQILDLEGAIKMTSLLLAREQFRGDKLLRIQLQKFARQKARLLDRISKYEQF